MNGFVEAALAGMVGNVLSAPVIALLLLRRSFRQDVASALIDAQELSKLRPVHREHGHSGVTPGVSSEMADRFAAQLEDAVGKLRGHLALITYRVEARRLARTCATAAWETMLSQRGVVEKAEVVAEYMELLSTALRSWRDDAVSRALELFPEVPSKRSPREGEPGLDS